MTDTALTMYAMYTKKSSVESIQAQNKFRMHDEEVIMTQARSSCRRISGYRFAFSVCTHKKFFVSAHGRYTVAALSVLEHLTSKH